MVPPPPQARPPSSGRIKGRGGGRTLDPQALLLMFPQGPGARNGGCWEQPQLSSLAQRQREAQNWVNEVAAAADVDDISGR